MRIHSLACKPTNPPGLTGRVGGNTSRACIMQEAVPRIVTLRRNWVYPFSHSDSQRELNVFIELASFSSFSSLDFLVRSFWKGWNSGDEYKKLRPCVSSYLSLSLNLYAGLLFDSSSVYIILQSLLPITSPIIMSLKIPIAILIYMHAITLQMCLIHNYYIPLQ